MRALLCGLVAGLGWVTTPGAAQERVIDVSVDAEAKELLPPRAADHPGIAGRGGLTVRATWGPHDEAPATQVGGSANGSLYANANYGDLLLPGSGFHGFVVEADHLGRPCTLSYEVYLSAGHRVTFMSMSTRFMADFDGNQIIKYDAPQNEFADRVETFAAVQGPDLNLVDQWQTVSAAAVVPAEDGAGQSIGQFNLSLNLGHHGAPGKPVWVRNVRLALADASPEGEGDAPTEETPPIEEPPPPPKEAPEPE